MPLSMRPPTREQILELVFLTPYPGILSGIALPLTFENQDYQDYFANPFPESTSSFFQVLSTEEESSNRSSTSFLRTSSSATTPTEPSSGLLQDGQDQKVTTDVEFNDPGARIPTPKPGSRGLSTTTSDGLLCGECPKQFSRKSELHKHVKTHSRDFPCPISTCNRSFYRARDVERHVSTRHSTKEEKNKYFCKFGDCDYATKGFSRNDNLTRHVRLQHGGGPRGRLDGSPRGGLDVRQQDI